MSKRILVTDKVHPLLISGLKENGFHVSYHPKLSYHEVKTQIDNYNGIIINSKVICDQSFLSKATHLDFIGRLGSGLDIINVPYAKSKNIEILRSPEGNANAVGEHALGMLLALLNKISIANYELREGIWNRESNRGTELIGKTVGIIGFGHTGPAFAEKLKGLDVEILVYDKYRKNLEVDFDYVTVTDQESLLAKSDVVSMHVPLTKETDGMVNSGFLEKMKEHVVLINTSRGEIVSTKDLLEALGTGQLGGVCLDVLENEKPQSWTENERRVYNELFKRNNVIVTPHIAGWTDRSLKLIAKVLLDKVLNFYQK